MRKLIVAAWLDLPMGDHGRVLEEDQEVGGELAGDARTGGRPLELEGVGVGDGAEVSVEKR